MYAQTAAREGVLAFLQIMNGKLTYNRGQACTGLNMPIAHIGGSAIYQFNRMDWPHRPCRTGTAAKRQDMRSKRHLPRTKTWR
jgi:hypothetical protein